MRVYQSWRRVWLAGFLALATIFAGAVAASGQEVLKTQEGIAHYYADKFQGRTTASGVPFNNNAMVAAHRTWPFGTIVRVTAVKSGKSVEVEIVDRIGKRSPAIIDLSQEAADHLGFLKTGEGKISVRLEAIK